MTNCQSCLHRLHLRDTGQGGASWTGKGAAIQCAQCDRNFNHVFQNKKIAEKNEKARQKN